MYASRFLTNPGGFCLKIICVKVVPLHGTTKFLMETNPQLQLASDFLQYTNKNIFLTGKAGTGKTTFLHNLKKITPKRLAVVAPTGVAAINAGGVTIHSFFQLPFGPFIPDSLPQNPEGYQKFNREKINLIKSLDLLVIDEISMVRADLLDGVDEVLRRYRNNQKPFGGIQLLMIGDLHQLSPIAKDEEWQLLKPYYETVYFFSSRALQKAEALTIELKHVYRQSDEYFIKLLNKVRNNQLDVHTLEELNERYISNFSPEDSEGYITLTTHNITAQNTNQKKLNNLSSASHIFNAEVKGDFPAYSYPTEPELELKEGAQVMFVKNDTSREKLFFNGKIGKITRIIGEEIYVKCPTDHDEILVTPLIWENMKYALNPETKEITQNMIGSFSQYPLKLAWAITIHKSQGLTFEKAIIDASESFAFGQVYVALSRCKTLEGMVLSSPLRLKSVKADETIAGFNKEAARNAPDEGRLSDSKMEYQRSLLDDLFDFKDIKTHYFQLKKVVNENLSIIGKGFLEELNKIEIVMNREIFEVAQKFKNQLHLLTTTGKLPEENEELQERIKKACFYFAEKIDNLIFQPSRSLGIETDNKAVRKSITTAFEKFQLTTFIHLSSLKSCVNGFSTLNYLHSRANAEIDFKTSLKQTSEPISFVSNDIAHPKLYSKLKLWRASLAKEKDVELYMILPTKSMMELTTYLPGNLKELEMISGIGKNKLVQFGEEIIELISEYCKEFNISKSGIVLPQKRVRKESSDAKPKVKKVPTAQITFDLYLQGKTINEIAKERGFSPVTIEGHLSRFIASGELNLDDFVEKEKSQAILNFIETNNERRLMEIKLALGESFSFNEIKFTLNYLEYLNLKNINTTETQ